MPAKKPAVQSNIAAVPDRPRFAVPDYLTAWAAGFYQSLVAECIAIRGSATAADLAILESAAAEAMTERAARRTEIDAIACGDDALRREARKVVESAARQKRSSLVSVGLSGDRRGVKSSRLAAFAANDPHTLTNANNDSPSRWDGIL